MSNQDFKAQLKRQLDYLGRSCALYDELKYEDEAIRMAVTLRTLFHQTRNSTSLLTHLGIKDLMIESPVRLEASPIPESTLFFQGLSLAKITHGKGATLLPILDDGPPVGGILHLEEWWNQIVWIFQDMVLTRKQIVLYAANKDGGAHVDKKLPETYEKYIGKDGYMSFDVGTIGGGQTFTYSFNNAHYSSLRQISHEVLKCKDLQDVLKNK